MSRWVQTLSGIFGLLAGAAAPGHAVFYPYRLRTVAAPPSVVAVGDLSSDGLADVALATRGGGDPAAERAVFLFVQSPENTLPAPTRYATGLDARGIALGDLNGDGRSDLAVCGDDSVVVLRQGPQGGLLPAQRFVTGAGADGVAIGDLNGDGRSDLAVSHDQVTYVAVLYQTAQGGFAAPQRYPVPGVGASEIAIADFTGDGLADLLFMRGLAGRAQLSLLPQDPRTHRLAAPYRFGWGEVRPSRGIAVADFNGDERPDVAMTWGTERPECGLGVFYQQTAGLLAPAVPYGTANGPQAIKAADMNRDGRPDLVVIHGGWQTLSVYYQRPDGRFDDPELHPIPYNSRYLPQSLGIGELNGDGWPDVVIADESRGMVVVHNAGPRDIITPETTLLSHPPAVSNGASLAFRFTGSDNLTRLADLQYRWNLNGGEWSAFTRSTTVNLTGIAEGWHEFGVAARDARGNVDPSPARFRFAVDRTPPAGLVLTGVGAYTSAASVVVSTDVQDNVADIADLTFAWRVNGGPWSDFSYAWRLTLSGLFEGQYTLEAKAADPAGNVSAPAALRFIIDRTPPDTRVERVTRDPGTGAVTIAFGGTDNFPAPNTLAYSWRIDGGAWSPFAAAAQTVLRSLAPGPHRIEVRARDAAGNIDPTPAIQDL